MKRINHDAPLVIPICVDDGRALYDEFDPADVRLSDAFKGYLEDFISFENIGILCFFPADAKVVFDGFDFFFVALQRTKRVDIRPCFVEILFGEFLKIMIDHFDVVDIHHSNKNFAMARPCFTSPGLKMRPPAALLRLT